MKEISVIGDILVVLALLIAINYGFMLWYNGYIAQWYNLPILDFWQMLSLGIFVRLFTNIHIPSK